MHVGHPRFSMVLLLTQLVVHRLKTPIATSGMSFLLHVRQVFVPSFGPELEGYCAITSGRKSVLFLLLQFFFGASISKIPESLSLNGVACVHCCVLMSPTPSIVKMQHVGVYSRRHGFSVYRCCDALLLATTPGFPYHSTVPHHRAADETQATRPAEPSSQAAVV